MKNKLLVIFFAFTLITTLGAPQPAHASGVIDAIVDSVSAIVDVAGNLIDNAISITSGLIQGSINLVTGGSFADGYKQGFCNLGGGGYGVLNGGDCSSSNLGTFWKIMSSQNYEGSLVQDANGNLTYGSGTDATGGYSNEYVYGVITPLGTTMVLEGQSVAYTVTTLMGTQIDSLLVDGVAQPYPWAPTTYTFSNVTTNHTISVAFKLVCGNTKPYWNGSGCIPCASPNIWNSTARTCDVPGVCGTANGKTYPSGATGYSPDAQCSKGVSTNTLFPPAGGTYAWLCNNNDSYSPMCQAWRAATTAVSSCGTAAGVSTSSPDPSYMCTTTSFSMSASPSLICDNNDGSGDTGACDNSDYTENPRWEWGCNTYPGTLGLPFSSGVASYCQAPYIAPPVTPTCSSTGPGTATTAVSGTYSVYAYGVSSSVTSVSFPTWGDTGGQDDIVWYAGVNQGGGTWRGDINMANHKAGNPEYGNINVHIYMAVPGITPDTWCGAANFSRTAATAATATVSVDSSAFLPTDSVTGKAGSTNASRCWGGVKTSSGTAVGTWSLTNSTTTAVDPFNAGTLPAGSYYAWFDCLNSAGSGNGPATAPFTVCSSGQTVVGGACTNPASYYTLSVFKSGTGSGTVTSNPVSAITGVPPTAASFVSGTSVTLTAGATSGTFTGWSGSGCSGTGTCTVIMDAAKSVVATFTVPSGGSHSISSSPTTVVYGGSSLISWSATGANECSLVGRGAYVFNTQPQNPYGTTSGSFSTGALTSNTRYSLGCTYPSGSTGVGGWVDTDITVCASGQIIVNSACAYPTYQTLSVATAGTGTGLVTGSGITCSRPSASGDTCSLSFVSGTSVTLTASPTSGNSVSWAGCNSSSGNTCTVAMSGGKTVFATFTAGTPPPPTPTLTFIANPATVASGDSSTLQWAASPEVVSCTASGNWSGSKSIPNGFETQSNITVSKSYTLTCVNSVGTPVTITKTISVIGCVTNCSAAKASTICSGQSFSDGCGGTCPIPGTRVCGSSWKEVAP